MRTALLFSGNARFSIDFETQIHNLKNSDIDWYICFWKRQPGFDPKISSNWYVKNSFQVLSKLKNFLPANHKIKFIELLDPSEFTNIPRDYEPFYSTPLNVWQQYNILKYCNDWRKELGSYDLVIRSRTDLGLNQEIDLTLAYESLSKNPNLIYTPNNQRNGYLVDVFGYSTGFCDQFAIGLPHIMNQYCDAVDSFDELYLEGIKYNPEYLLQTVLYRKGILWPPTSFEILRDPGHWVPIEHGKWAEI
jgi:hypothetical protein